MGFASKSLAHVITELCASDRKDCTISYIDGEADETQISYEELYDRALHVLRHLQEAGMQAGSQLVICTPINEQFLDAFWACQLGGITAVPVAVGQTQQHRQKFFNIYKQLDSAYVFSNRSTLEPMAAFAENQGLEREFQSIHERSIAADELTAVLQRGEVQPSNADEVALIQFSSGSTGNPKGVMLTHRNLITNVEGMHEWAHVTHDDSWFCWAPLYHDMGLIACHISPVVAGISQNFLPTERFARRPLLWLSKVAEKKATMISTPNFGLRHYLRAFRAKSAAKKLANMDLSHVRIICCAAEPISASLCHDFQEALAPYGLPADVIWPVYGLAEASVAVSFPNGGGPLITRDVDRRSLTIGNKIQSAESEQNRIRLVGVGQSIPGCEARIADEDGAECDHDVVGHIQIRGDNVTRGYYGDTPRATQDWLDTGDLGVFDGQLYIVGRAKDTIILNGVTYHAHDLESMCEEIDAVGPEKVACAGVRLPETGDEVVLVFIVHRGDAEQFFPLVRSVEHTLGQGAFIDPYRVIPVRSLPRTTSGKLQRFALVEAYFSGEYAKVLTELDAAVAKLSDAPKSAARTEVERTLLGICRTYITTEEVYVDDDLLDKGTSSLALVEIYEAVTECYPGVLDLPDFLEHTSVTSLAAYLEERL